MLRQGRTLVLAFKLPLNSALRAISVVGGGSGITQLSAGQDHVLALTGGVILAWGFNGFGALGTGTAAPVAGPVHVASRSGVFGAAGGGWAGRFGRGPAG